MFSFANSLEKLYCACVHVCVSVCFIVKHLKCIDMQERMRNTMCQFYIIICVAAPVFTSLVKNSLVLDVGGYSRESYVDFCVSCEIGTSRGEKHGAE